MMREWMRIVEMPINVRLHGGTTPGTFRDDDITLATRDHARTKINRIWHTSTADVELYLINRPLDQALKAGQERGDLVSNSIREGGIISRADAAKQFGLKLGKSDGITVLLTNNEGGERMPLTGWMIAHRLFHVFDEPSRRIGSAYDPKQRPKFPALARIMAPVTALVDHLIGLSRAAFPTNGVTYRDLFRIGTTKACRAGNLSGLGELRAECFAQFMLTGKVALNPLPDTLNGAAASPEGLAAVNQHIATMQTEWQSSFQQVIDFAKGKVFVF